MKLTTNFTLEEFACKDGTPVPEELMPNLRRLAKNLQVIRDYIKEALKVISGYRTEAYNKSVGGKPLSRHKKADAADLTTKSLTPKQLGRIIEKLIAEGKIEQGGLGIYPGFVHYDTRGRKARW